MKLDISKFENNQTKNDLKKMSEFMGNCFQINDIGAKQIASEQIMLSANLIKLRHTRNAEERIREQQLNKYGMTGENSLKRAIQADFSFMIDNIQPEPEQQDEPETIGNKLKQKITRAIKTEENPDLMRQNTMIKLVGAFKKSFIETKQGQKGESQERTEKKLVKAEEARLNLITKNAQKLITIDILETRAASNKAFYWCLRILKSRPYFIIVNLVIIGNTLTLSLDHYPMTEQNEIFFEVLN